MTRDDLLELLDLGGQEDAARTGDEPTIGPARTVGPDPAAGPTALAVDAWGLRRGRDLVAESERLRKTGTDEHAAADFFCAAFDPDPVLLESCADPRRREFLGQLLDTPEYHALHAATRLDDTAAAIAAAHFAEQFNGQVLRFPVPAGTGEGDRSVKEAVAAGLAALVAEHRRAVAEFDADTRADTVERAAEKIRGTRFKVEAYAAYLGDEKARLDRELADAQRELRSRVEALAAPVPS